MKTSSLTLSFGEKINKPFRLQNESSLTHDFLYNNFNKKILLNFLFKIFIKNIHASKLMHFQDEIVRLFFIQKQKY